MSETRIRPWRTSRLFTELLAPAKSVEWFHLSETFEDGKGKFWPSILGRGINICQTWSRTRFAGNARLSLEYLPTYRGNTSCAIAPSDIERKLISPGQTSLSVIRNPYASLARYGFAISCRDRGSASLLQNYIHRLGLSWWANLRAQYYSIEKRSKLRRNSNPIQCRLRCGLSFRKWSFQHVYNNRNSRLKIWNKLLSVYLDRKITWYKKILYFHSIIFIPASRCSLYKYH